jgi:hypothetical protein
MRILKHDIDEKNIILGISIVCTTILFVIYKIVVF